MPFCSRVIDSIEESSFIISTIFHQLHYRNNFSDKEPSHSWIYLLPCLCLRKTNSSTSPLLSLTNLPHSFQVEKFHTDLALMYLELVLKEDSHEELGEFRRKFRQHILRSQKVQFSYLLSRLESSPTGKNLHYEKAILYGKVMLLRCWTALLTARWSHFA